MKKILSFLLVFIFLSAQSQTVIEMRQENGIYTIPCKVNGLKIRFTVEDGSRADPEFLITVCKAIQEAGVDRISLPDTVGIMRPIGMYNFVKNVRSIIDTPLSIAALIDSKLIL